MRVGLVGYPGSGKTTLLDAVSGGHRRGDVASVPVPDPRFDKLCEAVNPKKRTPANVEIQDNAARIGSGFSDAARRMDALIHVVREFDSPLAPFHAGPDPARDHISLATELVLADLQLVENRLERLARSQESKSPGKPEYLERSLFERIRPGLEKGKAVRAMERSDEEMALLAGYQLLSAKPMIVAVNCDESRLGERTAFEERMHAEGTPAFRLCAEIEKQISQLEAADRAEFLVDLGIEEPASHALVRAVYSALGLITFFTAGENETRAWPLRQGATALKAADTVHSDIGRGFIRAEVVHYGEFEKAGNPKAAYSQGLMRLEGKDYVVRDGDIINIRHS